MSNLPMMVWWLGEAGTSDSETATVADSKLFTPLEKNGHRLIHHPVFLQSIEIRKPTPTFSCC